MPLVSIIIPVYNVEKYLENTIKSCLSQTLHDIEIIIVNDGSLDNSQSIIDFYSKQDKRIIPVIKKNEGVTLARKCGLEKSQSEYIFYLDGDDYLPNESLELLYKKAKTYDADWVVGDFIVEFENKKKIERRFKDFDVLNNIEFLRYVFENRDFYFTGRLIKTELIKGVELNIPSDITYGEDNLAVVQLGYSLKKAVKLDSFILYYIQRSESVTNRLKQKDLIQRANAIKLLLEFVKIKNIEDLLKEELNVFALNELYYCIMTGHVDREFSNKFLEINVIINTYRKGLINLKIFFVLLVASIHIESVIRIIELIKRYK